MKKTLAITGAIIAGVAGLTFIPNLSEAVAVDTGNGEGSAITATYNDTTYILFEDCSVAVEINGKTQNPGFEYLYQIPADNIMREPLTATATDIMPWCAQ